MKPSFTSKIVPLVTNPAILGPLMMLFVATASLHMNDFRLFWVNSWQDLKSPTPLAQQQPRPVTPAPAPEAASAKRPSAWYYNFVSANGSKCFLIVVDGNSGHWLLRPTLFAKNGTTASGLNQTHALAATNGGYFTPPSDQSASFVVINGKIVADPRKNSALVNSHKARPYLKQIFNRSELRVLTDIDHHPVFQIAQHNAPIPAGCQLLHCLQAGPALLPLVTARQEAFIRKDPDTGKDVDAIETRGDRPRTACGITADGHLLLLCVAGREDQSGSPGMTLQGVADLLKMLGCVQAINFDGGHSTTMVIDSCSGMGLHACPKSVCSAYPQTRVKSVLLLLPLTPEPMVKGSH